MNKKILLIIAVLASVALSARAQDNLVGNPGFETGTFSSWTQFGGTNFTAVDSGFAGVSPHSGNFQAHFGPTTPGGIMQTLTAPAGAYLADFWLAAAGGGPNDSFSASLGGVTFFSTPGIGAFPYMHITGVAIATGANPVLQFTTLNVPSYWFLDDINVVAVPEPGTLGLIGLGALGLLATLRKRLV
jgi:PEP-CTERM motif-containing protein